MNKGMTWESPPPPAGGSYDWEEVAANLRANPNQWLRVFEDGPVAVANAIRQQQIVALRPRRNADNAVGFEVRTRNNKPGPPKTCTLYLRYVQPEGGAA